MWHVSSCLCVSSGDFIGDRPRMSVVLFSKVFFWGNSLILKFTFFVIAINIFIFWDDLTDISAITEALLCGFAGEGFRSVRMSPYRLMSVRGRH